MEIFAIRMGTDPDLAELISITGYSERVISVDPSLLIEKLKDVASEICTVVGGGKQIGTYIPCILE